jgi:hypothetical protein
MDNTYFEIKIIQKNYRLRKRMRLYWWLNKIGLVSLFFLINYIADKLCAHHLRIFSALMH